jgi:hypothetical protein
LVELSALAGIFGIAQPAVRNNLWQMVQPATINSQANQLAPQQFGQFVSQPESNLPAAYYPESYQSPSPSAYTAQAVKPRDERNPSAWNASGYNPMGAYQ